MFTLSKLYDVPVVYLNLPFFEAMYCFICGRRRVTVFRYRVITLCPKSPSARGLVACLPVRLLFKSILNNALYPV